MDTFLFDYHTVAIKNILVDTKMQMGGGWTFTAEGDSPNIREFTLSFQAMKFFYNTDGTYDTSTGEYINNAQKLQEFFTEHRTYQHFIYPLHSGTENPIVRFAKPLELPEGIRNGGGMLKPFTITFIEKV